MLGIAHTRWATHGEPSDRNAHPHCDADNRIAVVHNGIIENAAELRARLTADGVVFRSDTDTEVLAHLIAAMPAAPLEAAVRAALRLVIGAYGLAVLDADAAAMRSWWRATAVRWCSASASGRCSSPPTRPRWCATRAASSTSTTARSRWCAPTAFETLDAGGRGRPARTPSTIAWTDEAFDKGDFAHYMRKEIAEQPDAVRRTLSGRLDARFKTAQLGGIELAARELLDIRRIKILGCGSAYHRRAASART